MFLGLGGWSGKTSLLYGCLGRGIVLACLRCSTEFDARVYLVEPI